MKILRLEDESTAEFEIEPREDKLLLSVKEFCTEQWSSMYVDKESAVEIIDYLKEFYKL